MHRLLFNGRLLANADCLKRKHDFRRFRKTQKSRNQGLLDNQPIKSSTNLFVGWLLSNTTCGLWRLFIWFEFRQQSARCNQDRNRSAGPNSVLVRKYPGVIGHVSYDSHTTTRICSLDTMRMQHTKESGYCCVFFLCSQKLICALFVIRHSQPLFVRVCIDMPNMNELHILYGIHTSVIFFYSICW